MMEGVRVIEQPLFSDSRGEVRRGLRMCDDGFEAFGEAYVSGILKGVVKGWKKHTRMHSNLIVVNGCVRFVLHDLRENSLSRGETLQLVLSEKVNHRLVIPCGLWLAFQGVECGISRVLNVASMVHDPEECETLPLQNDLLPSVDWETIPSAMS
jgi:dTDP-4-dehydrorhamnose 3,5-epimerase